MNARGSIPLLAVSLIASISLAVPAPLRTEEPAEKPLSPPPLHHGLEQKKLGFYAVYLPPDYADEEQKERRYPVCVILHGHGSTETGHGSLSDPLGREGVIYIAPRAAYPHEGVFMHNGEPGWTAWPTYPEAWGDFTGADYPLEHLGDIDLERLHSDWVADCIRDTRKLYRTDDREVIIIGHSQGAAWAHKVAVHHPSLVRTYFAYAGHYPEEFRTEAVAETMKQHEIAPVILHHADDTLVPKEATQVFFDFLEKHEVPHTGSILPGGTHALDIDIIERMRTYVDERCR